VKFNLEIHLDDLFSDYSDWGTTFRAWKSWADFFYVITCYSNMHSSTNVMLQLFYQLAWKRCFDRRKRACFTFWRTSTFSGTLL